MTGVLAGIAVGWLLSTPGAYHRSLPAGPASRSAAVHGRCASRMPDALRRRAGRAQGHRPRADAHARGSSSSGPTSPRSAGPSRIEACGGALLNVEYVSIIGWYLHKNTGQIAYQPLKVLKRSNPVI